MVSTMMVTQYTLWEMPERHGAVTPMTEQLESTTQEERNKVLACWKRTPSRSNLSNQATPPKKCSRTGDRTTPTSTGQRLEPTLRGSGNVESSPIRSSSTRRFADDRLVGRPFLRIVRRYWAYHPASCRPRRGHATTDV
jgi:hypothetical protein